MEPDISAWQNFYLMAGGASAALTGLIFVGLSMQARAIIAHPLFRDRAFTSLQSLVAGVLLSGAVLVPGQSALALGVEVGAVAAFFAGRIAHFAWLMRSVGARTRRRPGRRWAVEWIAWTLWLAIFIASAIALALGWSGGLFLLALAIVSMFGLNVWNAWVLIEEVAAQPSVAR
jgi:hypothetical protein